MFHGGGDDVLAPLAQPLDGTEDGPVVRLRAAGGKKDPVRLSALLGERLRQLHETDGTGCPGWDKMELYLGTARKNYEAGKWDLTPFPGATAEEVFVIEAVEGQADAVNKAIDAHMDYMIDGYSDYGPDEVPKLKNAVRETHGNYIFLCVCDEPAQAKTVIAQIVGK
jgi:hypothetical protein